VARLDRVAELEARTMATRIVCREVGFDCDAVVRAANTDEAMAMVANHVRAVHGIEDVTPDMVDAVIAVIHEEPASTAAAQDR
jgi:predicted small metal-binding protein